jgi:hypothetical protein
MCISKYLIKTEVNKSAELDDTILSWIILSLLEFIELNFTGIDHNRRLFNYWKKRVTPDGNPFIIKLSDFKKDKGLYFFLKMLSVTHLKVLFRNVLERISGFDQSDREILFEQ